MVNTSELNKTKQEYNELLKNIDRNLVVGEKWYLIDKGWFDQLQLFIKAINAGERNLESKHPGPVDNSSLLVQGESKEWLLRGDLTENVHFVFVASEDFAKLKSRYGLVSDVHEISRSVIETGISQKKPQIEMKPLKLLVAHPLSKTEHKLEISRSASMASLCAAARQSLNISSGDDIRLFLQHKGGVRNMELLRFSEHQALEELNLFSDQKLVVDSRPPNGAWALPANQASLERESEASEVALRTSSLSAGEAVFSSKDCGLCGLTNLGNTCFMNSALQCMCNTVPLSRFFVSNAYKSEVNEANPLGMRGEMAQAYGDLVKQMWAPRCSVVNPRNFKYTVGRFAPQFSGYAQQDSQELLAFLLDGLHEDLNRVRRKPYVELKDYDGHNDPEAALEAWHNYKLRNDSVVVDLFHGQLKSTLVCPACGQRSVTFDPFCYLSLPLSVRRDRTLLLTLVPLGAQAPIMQCQLTVADRGTIKDVADQLERLMPGVAAQKLLFAEVHASRFQKFYALDDEVAVLPDRDLVAYELPPDSTGQHQDDLLVLKIYSRLARKSGYFTSSSLVGLPLVLVVRRDEFHFDALRPKLVALMARFVDWNDPELQPDEGHGSGAEEVVAGESRAEPFKLFSTNAYGSTELGTLRPGQPVQQEGVGNSPYVCLEWRSVFQKFLGHELPVEKHESVYASKLARRSVALADCLDLFTTTERLGKHDLWYCPRCKQHQQATKKFDLWRVPEILIIHLKRFSYDSYYRRKIEALVDFPIEKLNVRPWIVDPRAAETCYDLIAVSNHYGGLCGGHYTAYARQHASGHWHLFDDSRVAPADAAEVVSKAAYVLVYARRHASNAMDTSA